MSNVVHARNSVPDAESARARPIMLSVAFGALALTAAAIAYFVAPRSAQVGAGGERPTLSRQLAHDSNALVDLPARAMSAYQAGRILSPAGDNALEFYLAALDNQPDDVGSNEAVLELVPLVYNALEAQMDAATRCGNQCAASIAEVERLFALIGKADRAASHTAALKARWQAQQNVATNVSAEIELAAARIPEIDQALIVTEQPQANEDTTRSQGASAPLVTQEITSSPAQPSASAQPSPIASASLNESAPIMGAPASARAPQIVPAQVISRSPAAFPAQARQRNLKGWVDLALSVDAEGRVVDVTVIDAQPAKVFNAEARRAALRWRFSPKRIDNKPVPSSVRQRINFSAG
jgi:periplasmic protein TonB